MRRVLNWACLLAVSAVAGLAFVTRQHSLAAIRGENDQLRRQLEATPAVQADSLPRPATNPVSALTPDEQRELLQLRGQVQPLRRELAELSNQVARAEQRKAASSNGVPTAIPPEVKAKAEAMRAEIAAIMQTDRGRNAQKLGVALRQYVNANGHLPSDLTELETQANSNLPPGITQKYEFVETRLRPGKKEALVVSERDPGTNGFRGLLQIQSDGAIRFVGLGGLPDYTKR
jgi:hypothetical protein